MATELDSARNKDGTLQHFAWPGGYDIRYLCQDGEVVCAKCANEWTPDEWEGQAPETPFIDWEGSGHDCSNCNEHLPSEYGDPEV